MGLMLGHRVDGGVVDGNITGPPVPEVDQVRGQMRFVVDLVEGIGSAVPSGAEPVDGVVVLEVHRGILVSLK